MAAVSNQPITEKRTAQAASATKDNAVYTRTVSFKLTDGETAGTATLTGLTIPKDTLVLGGAIKLSASQGTATLKFSLANGGDVCTAAAYTSTNRVGLNGPVQVVSTADTAVTYTTATAAVVGADVELTLILCAVGKADPAYTTFSI